MLVYFGDILRDLNKAKVNPNRTNSSTYAFEVQAWLREKSAGLELPLECETLSQWIAGNFSFDFKKEATRLWGLTNGSMRDIEKKYKHFLDKVVQFPGNFSKTLFFFMKFRAKYLYFSQT